MNVAWHRDESGQAGCGVAIMMALLLVIIFTALGWTKNDMRGLYPTKVSAQAAAPASQSPLPNLARTPKPAAEAPTTTAAPEPATTAAPEPATTAAPSGGGGQPSATPTTAAPPPPPPPASCGYPGSIGVSGGSVGSVGGTGGSFTVTSTPVTLSVGGLVNCGQHYRLAYSASGTGGNANGSDCKMDGFSLPLSSVQVGWTVNVTFELPPNACG